MTTVGLLGACVLAGVFTPTYVVVWQLWSARLSAQHRSLPPARPGLRPVAEIPAPRRPS